MTPADLARAACRGTDPGAFFDPARYYEAAAHCARCPLTGSVGPCVKDGFATRDEDSVRGGMRPEQRRKLYAHWRRARREGAA
jgi:hypothetical protein